MKPEKENQMDQSENADRDEENIAIELAEPRCWTDTKVFRPPEY